MPNLTGMNNVSFKSKKCESILLQQHVTLYADKPTAKQWQAYRVTTTVCRGIHILLQNSLSRNLEYKLFAIWDHAFNLEIILQN